MSNKQLWRNPREIVARIIIKADLVLETSSHFGNGDSDPLSNVDMQLVRDPVGHTPFLPGASIAGALRSYLREYEQGYYGAESPASLVVKLFGGSKQDDKSYQSSLLVYDAFIKNIPVTELRDGVRIDPKTRTAEESALYNIEVLTAGTTFELGFELVLDAGQTAKLPQAFAIALMGLQQGKIHLGARKRRGLGQCRVENWRVCHYDLTEPQGLLGWLEQSEAKVKSGHDIMSLLQENSDSTPATLVDKRHFFELQAEFDLIGSLLIRATSAEANAPDMVHLRSNGKPIIPGTSWAGVIRARAGRIAQTLDLPKIDIFEKEKEEKEKYQQASKIIVDVFGGVIKGVEQNKAKPKPIASRLIITETEVVNSVDLVQNRVKIDRFTGGSYPSALFNQMPIWAQSKTLVKLKLTLMNPEPAEIGLLLQVLKDLWTGDLPIGGESSVGRGRLQGRTAILCVQGESDKVKPGTWTIDQPNEKTFTVTGDITVLEKFAKALSGGCHE